MRLSLIYFLLCFRGATVYRMGARVWSCGDQAGRTKGYLGRKFLKASPERDCFQLFLFLLLLDFSLGALGFSYELEESRRMDRLSIVVTPLLKGLNEEIFRCSMT